MAGYYKTPYSMKMVLMIHYTMVSDIERFPNYCWEIVSSDTKTRDSAGIQIGPKEKLT